MDELLTLLEKDCRQTPQQLATMLGRTEQEITDEIARFEKEHIILGYPALVDWTKTDDEMVTALIEVRIAPQRGDGFDRIAERIYQYEEVESLYLMSGAYDLAVTITGKSLREVAEFVHARLAIIEGVPNLTGAPVAACDLRAGAAMVIAGLCAEGTTVVEDVEFIERGYQDIVGKLRGLGADIIAVSEPDGPAEKLTAVSAG